MFSTMPRIGHVDLLEHGDAFAHHAQRGFLRRGDDHAAVQRHGLAERELGVAGARRQVHQQIIQFAPVHRVKNCWMVFMIIGPRQMTGWSPSSRKPMLISFTPWLAGGTSFSSSLMVGRSWTPIISGMLGP